MSFSGSALAFCTFLLVGAIVLVGPAAWLHLTVSGWSPVYIPEVIASGALFSATWPSWLATAITLMSVFLAFRFAVRSTSAHARGVKHGIGGHPVMYVFGSGVVLLALYAALGAVALATEWIALALAFMIATLVGFFVAALYGGLLIAAFANGRWQFRPAVEAAEKGFKPSLVARDFTANGILMIDRENRKVFVAGETWSFDDVSEVQWENRKNSPSIRVVLSSGNRPVKTIGYQSESQRDQDLRRIGNALGFA